MNKNASKDLHSELELDPVKAKPWKELQIKVIKFLSQKDNPDSSVKNGQEGVVTEGREKWLEGCCSRMGP